MPYDKALQETHASVLNREQRTARAKLLMKYNRRLEQSDAEVLP